MAEDIKWLLEEQEESEREEGKINGGKGRKQKGKI